MNAVNPEVCVRACVRRPHSDRDRDRQVGQRQGRRWRAGREDKNREDR